MKHVVTAAAIAVILGVGGVLVVGQATPTAAADTSSEVQQQRATFAIENMTCALCPVTVRTAMNGVVGVSAVEVDFDAKTAAVTFDPSMTNLEQIAEASTNAGYPAQPVEQ